MLSYTGLRNLYGKFTQDDSTANLTHGDTLINLALREIISFSDWDFLEKSATQNTVADQRFYNFPGDYEKLLDPPHVLIDNTRYIPQEAPSRGFWDKLNQQEDWSSDFPEWYYIFDNQIGLYPKPSSSTANALVIKYKRNFADLTQPDYIIGTVDAITNGDATVSGDSTVWTSPMAGRFLKVTPTDVAATGGDGLWYEIASRTSDTEIELSRLYNGTSLASAAAASYIIGQMSPLPEQFHELPVLKAAEQYWLPKDDQRADRFANRYDKMLAQLKEDHASKSTSVVIDNGGRSAIINPNLTVQL